MPIFSLWQVGVFSLAIFSSIILYTCILIYLYKFIYIYMYISFVFVVFCIHHLISLENVNQFLFAQHIIPPCEAMFIFSVARLSVK